MKKQTKFGLVLAAAAVISVSIASLVSARGWVQQGADWYYVDGNNDYVTETIQSSGASKFYLGADGAMVRDYFLEDDGNGNTYYFGSNGAMVTNTWVAIESSVVENTQDYVPDNYWYYFQSSGKAMKGTGESMKKATIDGKKYGFNENGQMAIGWVDDAGKTTDPDASNPFVDATYYCGGDNDGALRSGWVTYYDGYADETSNKGDYANLYFYFKPSNNKKVAASDNNSGYKSEKINGRYYAFDSNGVMLSGWDPFEEDSSAKAATYFSGEDDGHQVKKGWVYAVPSEKIGDDGSLNEKNEEKYMYFGSDGYIKKNSVNSKINGKYYCFDTYGIMKTGLVLWDTTDGAYLNTIDLDYAKGEDIAKKGILTTGDGEFIEVDVNGKIEDKSATEVPGTVGHEIKIHYFGDDGARKTGLNTIEFNDGNYILNTNGSGHKGQLLDKKKYYSLGIALKADSDLRYGIIASDSKLDTQKGQYENRLAAGNYEVLTTSGSRQKGGSSAKKDANENYWLIDNNYKLEGIWTVNIKRGGAKKGFTTEPFYGVSTTSTTVTTQDIDELVGNFYDAGDVEEDFDFANVVWNVNKKDGYITFSLADTYEGRAYQSSYNGKQNVWLPFGMIDEMNKTQAYYEKTDLDDSYFLNCYWE